LLVGFIFAVLTFPIFSYIKKIIQNKFKFINDGICALITVLFVGVILGLVITFLSSQLSNEIPKFIQIALNFIQSLPSNEKFISTLSEFGISPENSRTLIDNINQNIRSRVEGALSVENLARAINVGQEVLNVVFNQILFFIIFMIAWFNGLLFGKSWINTILTIFPFEAEENKLIKKDLTLGIRNVIYANLLAGLLNSLAVLAIMLIFQIPGVFIVTIIVFLIGFLPVTPSELGYAIPLAILFSTNPFAAIVIAILAELFILWQNYVFLPKIVLTGTSGNPLFIITSVLAAISMFGVMGFIIGPTIMIFVNTLAQIILRRMEKE
jgi:predicted PurR-regulated permease PerM